MLKGAGAPPLPFPDSWWEKMVGKSHLFLFRARGVADCGAVSCCLAPKVGTADGFGAFRKHVVLAIVAPSFPFPVV